MSDTAKAEAGLGEDREKSTARTEAPASTQIGRAQHYLASAFHPLTCRANGYVVSGGVTDGSMCDCGLTALRVLFANAHV